MGINFSAQVTMTDLPEVLDNLINNIDHNRSVWEPCGGSATAKSLKWGSSDIKSFPSPDVLIAADCVYYKEVLFILWLMTIINNICETHFCITYSIHKCFKCPMPH
jgi:hypothetical protein